MFKYFRKVAFDVSVEGEAFVVGLESLGKAIACFLHLCFSAHLEYPQVIYRSMPVYPSPSPPPIRHDRYTPTLSALIHSPPPPPTYLRQMGLTSRLEIRTRGGERRGGDGCGECWRVYELTGILAGI